MAVFGWLSRACTKQGAQRGGKLVGLNNAQDMQSAGPGHTDWQSIIYALSSVGLSQKHQQQILGVPQYYSFMQLW